MEVPLVLTQLSHCLSIIRYVSKIEKTKEGHLPGVQRLLSLVVCFLLYPSLGLSLVN